MPRLELIDYLQASGDLNHDGQIDTAVILSYSPGGSGIFVYLAIMTSRGARPINLDTKLLGDRVQVRSIEITNDLLVVDLLQHGDDDPSCCPGEVVLYQFHLENDQIVPASSPLQTFRLSLATLEDKTYQLHHADLPDEIVSRPIFILTVQDSVMTAVCGCRRYQMAVDEQKVPGDMVVRDPIRPIDSCNNPDTDTDCMYLLQLLPRIYRYGWQQGKLTFSYETSGTYGNLYFSVDDH